MEWFRIGFVLFAFVAGWGIGFVAGMDSERKQGALIRKDKEFFQGKCERLELALMSKSPNDAAQNYAARTDSPIEQTTVEVDPPKKTWQQFQGDWSKLSEAEQEKILGWSKEPQ